MEWWGVVLVLLVATCHIQLSQQQDSIFYKETPLPNKSIIAASKVDGYVWPIAVIGTFTLPQASTGPGMMQFAVDEINSNDNLIPGVKIQLNYCEVLNDQSNAVLASLYEILTRKVKGIAGGFPSQETVNIQLVSKLFKIPQISARANTDDLSDKTNYPYFARTTLADSNQARSIVQLFSAYGWKRAILIYTNEQYGISGNSLMLNTDLEIFSVKVLYDPTNLNYTEPFSQIEKFVKENNVRVFLYFMLPPVFVPFMRVLNTTYASDEFAYVITTPVASSMIEYPQNFANSMPNVDGALLVSAAVGDGPVYQAALPKWNALNRTEYPGLRPDPYSFWNWYDTMYIFANALDKLMKTYNAAANMSVLDNIKGPEYFNAIKQVDFMGATGRVVFDNSANMIGNAGVWNLRNGSIVQLGTYYGSNTTLVLSSDPVFFRGRTTIPSDSHLLPIEVVPRSIKVAMGVLTAISFLIVFTVAFFLMTHPAAFAKSGRFYCCIIVIGAVLALIAAVLAIPDPTDALCLAFPWFLGIGFMLVFGCLFLRTWALFQVFRAAEQMKKTNFNPALIMRILGAFLLVELVLLIVWTAYDPPEVKLVTVGTSHRQFTCKPGHIAFWGVFIGYKGIWMLFGAIISFLVRNVREDYNQSAGLGMSVYNCLSVTLIAVVIGFILDHIPNVTVVVQVMAILIAFSFTLILLFSRQIYCIITGKEDVLAEPYPHSSNISRGGSKSNSHSHSAKSANSAKSKELDIELA